jgi:parvulin-like peptidyl-prolyl isomerase
VTPRIFGRVVALVAVVASVGVASGCSSTLRDAATVTFKNGGDENVVHIRRDDFEDDVRNLSQTKEVRQQLAQVGVPAKAPPDGTADANLSAFWLTTLIQSAAVKEEFEARGLKLTDQEVQEAAAGITDLGKLDKSTKDKIVENQAMSQKLVNTIGASVPEPAAPTEEQLRAVYEQNAESFNNCASGKEVSHILVPDEATANQIKQEIENGANFADEARTKSTDGSASAGGSLGCLGAQPFVTEFQQAADNAPLNQVVGPVKTQFGYHLILVTPWNPSFDKLKDQIAQQVASQAQQQVQQQRQQLYSTALVKRLKSMGVKVDPRYGTWDAKSGQYEVVPPKQPAPRTHREQSTTTTSTLPAAPLGNAGG